MIKRFAFLATIFMMLISCIQKWVIIPEITGKVLDENNNPLADVNIKLVDEYQSELITQISDHEGKFHFKKIVYEDRFVPLAERPKSPFNVDVIVLSKLGYYSDTLIFNHYTRVNNKKDIGKITLNKIK
jgi:hypothetical protein